MKLVLGNRNYSSWSLRGWLACKQSGLAFEEEVIPLLSDAWDAAKLDGGAIVPSGARVPVLWDGDAVVWDSLAILEYLGDRVGRDRFWPRPDAARAMARSLVAEMHSGFPALRAECPMNVRARVPGLVPSDAVRVDVIRILQLWAEARARFGQGGPFLFGSFCAADIAYAPVVSRFITYDIHVPGFAQSYMEAVWEHPWMRLWADAAAAEPWEIARYAVAPANA